MARKGGGPGIRSIVVAGELGTFLEAAEQMGERLPKFMSAYRRLVDRYMHSRPLFSKFIGDRFVYVYEVASPSFARNVLHSTMVLEGAFQEAMTQRIVGLEGLTVGMPVISSLNIGLSEGRLFRIESERGSDEDLVGLPLFAARSLAEYADEVRSHILVDADMALDRLCRRWLESELPEDEDLVTVDSEADVAAHIVTPESLLREYRTDRDRYLMVNATEALKEEIDKVTQADVFSFRLQRGGRPHIELVFNPLNYRGPVDRLVASSILLVHASPKVLTLYPELIVPTDRLYTVQIPYRPADDYEIIIGLVIQSPESDLIGEELQKIRDTEEIVERLEGFRNIFTRARMSNRLSLAYYRF